MYRRFRKGRKSSQSEAPQEEMRDERTSLTNEMSEALENLNRPYMEHLQEIPIASSLKQNLQFIDELFADCSDFVVRHN